MTDRKRPALVAAGAIGAAGVGFGAFGAHGLGDNLGDEAAAWFATATAYALPHAAAAAALALANLNRAAWAMIIGVVLFSGSLYALALSSLGGAPLRALGMITPLGGVFMLVGWMLMIGAGLRRH